MEKSEFKAVDWVRQIRDRHYALTRGMTTAARIAFYREGSKRLRAKLAKPRQATRRATPLAPDRIGARRNKSSGKHRRVALVSRVNVTGGK